MYAGALLLLASSIAGHASIANVCIGLIALGFVLVKISMEERFLKASLPDYVAYTQSTKALIPFLL